MNAAKLKAWMTKTGMTSVDIASALKISPQTVERYLKGKTRPFRSTITGFERLIETHSNSDSHKAAG